MTEEDIAEIVSSWTGIRFRVCRRASAEARKLEDHLHLRVVGQDEAIKACKRRPPRPGRFTDPNRRGSFIFLGPTGVGKTNCPRARGFCSTTKRHDRIDMSEYMGNTVAR